MELLPSGPKRALSRGFDWLVHRLSDGAQRLGLRRISRFVRLLSSEAEFLQAFDDATERAVRHWEDTYPRSDIDAVQSLMNCGEWWKDRALQEALRKLMTHPGSYLPEEHQVVRQHFVEGLPGMPVERIEQAQFAFLKCLTAEARVVPGLETKWQSADHLLWVGSPGSRMTANLPYPTYDTFVNRREEVSKATDSLRPWPAGPFPVVTIDGAGGIGKTAVARYVAQHYVDNFPTLPPGERFDAIIWASAKEVDLKPSGRVTIPSPTRTLEDIYLTIASVLEREDINRARGQERAERAAQALTRQRTLLVIDNLETVTDESVQGFLCSLPISTKALVTSRHRTGVGYPIHLMELGPDDRLQLIRNECRRKNVRLNERQEKDLSKLSGGVGKLIEYSIGKMAFGEPYDKIVGYLDGTGDRELLQFCYDRSVDLVRETGAHELLLAMALFVDGADAEALRYVAGLEASRVAIEDWLIKLVTLSLLESREGRYWMSGVTRNFVAGEFQDEDEFSKQARQRFVQHFAALVCEKLGVEYWAGVDTWENYNFVEKEIRGILAAFEIGAQLQMDREVRDIAIGTVHQLWRMGLWEKRVYTLQTAIQAAERLGRTEDQALMRVDGLGWVFLSREDYDRALEEIEIGESLGEEIRNDDVVALAARYRAMIMMSQEDYPSARGVLEKTLGRPCSPRVHCRLLLTMARLNYLQNEYHESEQNYNRAIRICHEHGEMTGVAGGCVGLGDLYLAKGRPDLARPQYHAAIGKTDNTRDIDIRARATLGLANVEIHTDGSLPRAREYLETSIDGFTRCGMKAEEEEARETLASLPNAGLLGRSAGQEYVNPKT